MYGGKGDVVILGPNTYAKRRSVQVTMYTTEWCGHCRRLKRQLAEEGISVSEVDVDREPSHDDRIIAATGGYRIVPTLEIEGRLLVNPSVQEVRAALAG
ncbi:MAG: glutaredoxin family protein [Actinomycetota bacterium]